MKAKKRIDYGIESSVKGGKLHITVNLDTIHGETAAGNLRLTPSNHWIRLEDGLNFNVTVIQKVEG